MTDRRRFLTALGTAGTAAIAGCSDPTAESSHSPQSDEETYSPGTDAQAEWPLPAYDQQFTACNPDAAAPRESVSERWSVELDGAMPRRPVVAAGKVLVATDAGLVALTVESGEESWRYESEDDGPVRMTAPIVRDGAVYVGVDDPRGLLALDVENGTKQGHASTTGFVDTAPTFGRGGRFVYAGDDTGHVYQIDTTSGEIAARTEVFGGVTAIVSSFSTVLVGTRGGEVYSLYRSGEVLTGYWRRRVDGKVTGLAARNDGVYVSTWGGPVYRLTNSDRAGATRWKTDRGATDGIAVAAHDVVGMDASGLRTFVSRTGDDRWNREASFTAAPAVAGDTIYVGGVTAGDDGTEFVAAYPLRGGGDRGPLRPGSERWRFDVDGIPGAGIAVADGAVFACTGGLSSEGGPQVYALGPA